MIERWQRSTPGEPLGLAARRSPSPLWVLHLLLPLEIAASNPYSPETLDLEFAL